MGPGLDEEQYTSTDRRQPSSMSTQAIVGILALAVTLITLVFTAGYNWRGVTEIDKRQSDFEATVKTDYMRREASDGQFGVVNTKLDAITKQLDDLEHARTQQR